MEASCAEDSRPDSSCVPSNLEGSHRAFYNFMMESEEEINSQLGWAVHSLPGDCTVSWRKPHSGLLQLLGLAKVDRQCGPLSSAMNWARAMENRVEEQQGSPDPRSRAWPGHKASELGAMAEPLQPTQPCWIQHRFPGTALSFSLILRGVLKRNKERREGWKNCSMEGKKGRDEKGSQRKRMRNTRRIKLCLWVFLGHVNKLCSNHICMWLDIQSGSARQIQGLKMMPQL